MDSKTHYYNINELAENEARQVLPVLVSFRQWHDQIPRQSREAYSSEVRSISRRLLLCPYQGTVITLHPDAYLVLLYEENAPDYDELRSLCLQISMEAGLYGCELVCYLGELLPAEALPAQVRRLTKADRDNVHISTGAIAPEELCPPKDASNFPSPHNWMFFFFSGKKEELLDAIREYFRQAINFKVMSRKFLVCFQQDLIQDIYFALKQKGIQAHELYENDDGLEDAEATVRSYLATLEWLNRIVTRAMSLLNIKNETISIARQVCDYINSGIDKPLTRGELSKLLHLSEGHIARVFRQEMGMSISEYRIRTRMDMACQMLKDTDLPINTIAAKVGFNDYSYFFESFKKHFGVSPKALRNKS